MIGKYYSKSNQKDSLSKDKSKISNSKILEQKVVKKQEPALSQDDNQILFTISIGILNRKSNLDVRKNDNANKLAQRFCKQHMIKESQSNIRKVKQKLIIYLKNLLSKSNSQQHSDLTTKLTQNIQAFLKQNCNLSHQTFKNQPNDTKNKRTLILENKRQKQNVCSKQSQKSKDQQILIKAYQTIFKSSKEPVFKQMAQQYLIQHGRMHFTEESSDGKKLKDLTNIQVKQLHIRSGNKEADETPVKLLTLSSLNVSNLIQKSQEVQQPKVSRIRKNFQIIRNKTQGKQQMIHTQNKDSEFEGKGRLSFTKSNYHYDIGDIGQKLLIREQEYSIGAKKTEKYKSNKRFSYLADYI